MCTHTLNYTSSPRCVTRACVHAWSTVQWRRTSLPTGPGPRTCTDKLDFGGSLVRYRQLGVGALLLDKCKSIFSVWQPAALWTHDITLTFKCFCADKTGILSPTDMFSNQNQNRSGLWTWTEPEQTHNVVTREIEKSTQTNVKLQH